MWLNQKDTHYEFCIIPLIITSSKEYKDNDWVASIDDNNSVHIVKLLLYQHTCIVACK